MKNNLLIVLAIVLVLFTISVQSVPGCCKTSFSTIVSYPNSTAFGMPLCTTTQPNQCCQNVSNTSMCTSQIGQPSFTSDPFLAGFSFVPAPGPLVTNPNGGFNLSNWFNVSQNCWNVFANVTCGLNSYFAWGANSYCGQAAAVSPLCSSACLCLATTCNIPSVVAFNYTLYASGSLFSYNEVPITTFCQTYFPTTSCSNPFVTCPSAAPNQYGAIELTVLPLILFTSLLLFSKTF